jgi:hypothetical protein
MVRRRACRATGVERKAVMPVTRDAPRLARPAATFEWWWPLVAIVAVAVAIATTRIDTGPRFVRRVVLVNPTPYELNVEVSGGDRAGWMPVTSAARSSASTAEEIADVGTRWVFRFSGQGAAGGDVSIPRAQLERSQWRVEIPAAVGERLRAAGAPPSP